MRETRTSRRAGLPDLYASHQGKLSDKWSSYLEAYDEILAPYRDRPITLLEIGVQNGGSLELWAEYFARARAIYGCDIDPRCALLAFDDKRIRIAVGDAKDSRSVDTIRVDVKRFDIIVDDGSHSSGDVVAAFAAWFKHLRPGGVYIVEDIHSSYWADYDGGLHHPYSALAFFRRFADLINYEHWGLDRARSAAVAHVLERYGVSMSERDLATVHGIRFINSLVVIEKRSPSENRLGTRVVVGREVAIDGAAKSAPKELLPPDQSSNEWATSDVPPEAELQVRLRDLDALRVEAKLLLSESSDLRRERLALKAEVRRTKRAHASLSEELASARNSIDVLSELLRTQEQRGVEALEAAAQRDTRALNEAAVLRNELKDLQVRAHRLEIHLDVMQTSRSWRVTAPIRAVTTSLRHTVAAMRSTPERLARGRSRLLSAILSAAVPVYRRSVPLRTRMLVPPTVRASWKARMRGTGAVMPDYPDPPLEDELSKARGAFSKKDWTEARRRWQAIARNPAASELTAGLARLHVSVIDRLENSAEYRAALDDYASKIEARRATAPRIVVFTAIVGGYDSLKLPATVDATLDYVAFSDGPLPDSGLWQIRPIPFGHSDPTRTARWVKLHPHWLLPDYDIAIWVDANVMILGDIMPMIDRFASAQEAVAGVPHSVRTSVYDEAAACKRLGRDDAAVIDEQVSRYQAMGFTHDDLVETNLMMLKLRRPETRRFLAAWWRELDRHSKRDQLSVNVAMREASITWLRLMDRPLNVRTHPDFAYDPHDRGVGPAQHLIRALRLRSRDPYDGLAYSAVLAERLAERRGARVDVVVCVHDALGAVTECLDSVDRHRSAETQRLIIIDDGSAPPTAEFLSSFAASRSWVDLYRSHSATGYTAAANRGLQASIGEFTILLNSDTIVTRGWVEKLVDALLETHGTGLAGPMSNAASFQSIPEIESRGTQTAVNRLPTGMTPDRMNEHCENWASASVRPQTPLLHGFCLALTREVIQQVGLFDGRAFPRGYGEENDYCFRASDAGFGLVVASHTFVYHHKSQSYGEQRDQLAHAGDAALVSLHGHRRVGRAVATMQLHPMLVDVRRSARSLVRGAVRAARVPGRPYTGLAKLPIRADGSADGTGYIRVLQPLSHPGVSEIVHLSDDQDDASETARRPYEFVVTQRAPFTEVSEALRLVGEARRSGAALIYDIDDDLLHLPEDHPASAHYAGPARKAIDVLAREADAVLVSTDPLRERFLARNRNTITLPNALDERVWLPDGDDGTVLRRIDAKAAEAAPSVTRLLYMGTRTHDRDLAVVLDAVNLITERFGSRVEFHCIGGVSGSGLRTMTPISIPASARTYPGFARWLVSCAEEYAIALAPLIESEFNHHKSYIKYLDYGILGLAPILSDITPYRTVVSQDETGVLVSNTTQEWYLAMTRLIEEPETRVRLARNAYLDVTSHHTLKAQASARRQLWSSLLR